MYGQSLALTIFCIHLVLVSVTCLSCTCMHVSLPTTAAVLFVCKKTKNYYSAVWEYPILPNLCNYYTVTHMHYNTVFPCCFCSIYDVFSC